MFATLQANGTQKLSTACDVALITLNIYGSCLKERKSKHYSSNNFTLIV